MTTTRTGKQGVESVNLTNETFERQGMTIRTRKPAPAKTAKQAAYWFFLRNAGCSWNPKTETKLQGMSRGARQLAKAERDARALGYSFDWTDDWGIGSHVKEFGAESYPEEPSTCEICIMRNEGGTIVQTLGCVDDATREYRRVVEAELALEELG